MHQQPDIYARLQDTALSDYFRNAGDKLVDESAVMSLAINSILQSEGHLNNKAIILWLIQALETASILHETYFKLIIATGMRRGECCALKWEDINYAERSIHVCRNAVKTTGNEIIVKAPKTKAGNRYVYFSAEMESLLREYEAFCAAETERYDRREQTKDDYVFRRKGMELPMTPSTFTWRFKKILRANNLPDDLNVHSLRHTAASLFIASGTDVGTVAGLLGHSQPSTTLDIYTHAFDKNKKAASQIMQSSLEI